VTGARRTGLMSGIRTVTKEEWEDYRSVQKSGQMNMMAHPDAMRIIPLYDELRKWFEIDGNEDDYE